MAATRSEIRSWLKQMRRMGATHMVVKCDTFDWEDYPIFVMPGEDVHKAAARGDRLVEVYSAKMSDEEQLKQDRVFNWE